MIFLPVSEESIVGTGSLYSLPAAKEACLTAGRYPLNYGANIL